MDIKHDSNGGILKKILKEGDGTDRPQIGSKVFVRYTGTLGDGTIFDKAGDNVPFHFTIGEGEVIDDFEFAVLTMTCNESSSFTFQPNYNFDTNHFQKIISPDTWLTFEIHLIKWSWKDISREKNGSITKQIIEPGVDCTRPSSISMVDIHLEKEQNGSVVEETDVQFRLGEGETYNISQSIEQALRTFNSKEKSRLFIHEQQNVWGEPDSDKVYVIKLNSFEKFKEDWSLTDEDRIEQAKILKEKGTEYFQQENYKLAHQFYEKMLYYLKDSISKTESQMEEIKSLTVKAYLNSALCYLNLYKYSQARDNCDNVLTIEPTNVKAMFRKGQAFIGLNEVILAKQCFEAILQYEPNNSAAKSKIQKCNSILSYYDKIEKSVYLNMFDKFAKKDESKEKKQPKQQPDVMDGPLGFWSDHERERAPTQFELDNPDIIILNLTEEFKNM